MARLCNEYPDAALYCLDLRLHAREQIAWLEVALAAVRKLGEKPAEGNHLGNLGLAYADLGEMRRAIEYYEQALAIAREIGDRRGEGNRLFNLGAAYEKLGETAQAIAFTEEALKIFEAIESPYAERAREQLARLGRPRMKFGG